MPGRLLLVVLLGLVWTPPAHASPTGLTTGFFDPIFQASDPLVRDGFLERVGKLGGSVVRLQFSWKEIAPATAPPGFDDKDPSDPRYRWDRADQAIRAAEGRGLRVLMTLTGPAPSWAVGADPPAGVNPGIWRPNATLFGRLARAAASRYSGRYVDPATGSVLPRVRLWQAWNEPNLGLDLMPQWGRQDGRFVEASPTIYRGLLNAFYAGVKSIDALNTVVSAGLGPYGDPEPGGPRIMPARFLRRLLCLQGHRLRRKSCPDPARLDVLSHHPYSVGGPTRRALNADDVNVPDVWKLARILRAAEANRTVLPAKAKRLWVTEFSWDTSPPDPSGVPVVTQAKWLEQSLYLLWRQGVDTIFWFRIVDDRPVPDYAHTNQSGVLFVDGRPKPSATAFRFPFVVAERGGRLWAWGKSPCSSGLRVSERTERGWRTSISPTVQRSGMFYSALPKHIGRTLRASCVGIHSLAWRTRTARR